MIKDNSDRSRTAMILIGVVLILEILMLISSYMQYDLLWDLKLGIEVTDEWISFNDTREAIIGVLYLIAYIISMVTYIRWFRRAYYNLHIMSPRQLAFSEGLAAGSWFIPIANLFQPYQIMKELYSEANQMLAQQLTGFKERNYSLLLRTWWFLWVISNFMGNLITQRSFRAETIDQLIGVTYMNIIASIIGVPLAILAIKVIRDHSELEEKLAQVYKEEGGIVTGEDDPYDNEILDTPLI